MIPYIVASDLVFCDFSAVAEECVLCDKNIVFSDFDVSKLYKHTISARLKGKVPTIKSPSELEKLIKIEYPKSASKYLNDIKKEVMAPKGFYDMICKKITKELCV